MMLHICDSDSDSDSDDDSMNNNNGKMEKSMRVDEEGDLMMNNSREEEGERKDIDEQNTRDIEVEAGLMLIHLFDKYMKHRDQYSEKFKPHLSVASFFFVTLCKLILISGNYTSNDDDLDSLDLSMYIEPISEYSQHQSVVMLESLKFMQYERDPSVSMTKVLQDLFLRVAIIITCAHEAETMDDVRYVNRLLDDSEIFIVNAAFVDDMERMYYYIHVPIHFRKQLSITPLPNSIRDIVQSKRAAFQRWIDIKIKHMQSAVFTTSFQDEVYRRHRQLDDKEIIACQKSSNTAMSGEGDLSAMSNNRILQKLRPHIVEGVYKSMIAGFVNIIDQHKDVTNVFYQSLVLTLMEYVWKQQFNQLSLFDTSTIMHTNMIARQRLISPQINCTRPIMIIVGQSPLLFWKLQTFQCDDILELLIVHMYIYHAEKKGKLPGGMNINSLWNELEEHEQHIRAEQVQKALDQQAQLHRSKLLKQKLHSQTDIKVKQNLGTLALAASGKVFDGTVHKSRSKKHKETSPSVTTEWTMCAVQYGGKTVHVKDRQLESMESAIQRKQQNMDIILKQRDVRAHTVAEHMKTVEAQKKNKYLSNTTGPQIEKQKKKTASEEEWD